MPVFNDAVPLSVVPQWNASYLTITDASSYFATKLASDDWDNASDDDRNKALITASRAIDGLRFAGIKTNIYNHKALGLAYIEQPLEFPRDGHTNIPIDILIACCEIALAYLGGAETEFDIQDLGVESQGFASVKQSRRLNFVEPHLRAGIPSATAWMHLKRWLADPREIHVTRVS